MTKVINEKYFRGCLKFQNTFPGEAEECLIFQNTFSGEAEEANGGRREKGDSGCRTRGTAEVGCIIYHFTQSTS